MRIKLPGAVCVTLIATLAFAASAMALAGTKTFAQTYPHASTLCAKASAGTLNKKLEASKTEVLHACTTLQDPFVGLQTTVTAAESQYAATRAAEKALAKSVCDVRPKTAESRAACDRARAQKLTVDANALLTRHDAVHLYFSTLETNRIAFWSTIHSLRGGAGITADPPITQPSPSQNPS
jgi:hypothetical protein